MRRLCVRNRARGPFRILRDACNIKKFLFSLNEKYQNYHHVSPSSELFILELHVLISSEV